MESSCLVLLDHPQKAVRYRRGLTLQEELQIQVQGHVVCFVLRLKVRFLA
jgi:hypothetical protein